MASRIKGITVEIGGDTTGLDRALRQVNNTIRETQSNLRDINRLLKLDPGNTELVAQKQRALQQAIGATEEKLHSLREAQRQAQQQLERGELGQDQYDALQREIIETENELQRLQQEAVTTNATLSRMDEVGRSMESIGGKIAGVGQTLTTGLTLPLAAVGAAGVKSFAEVDRTMQLTNATMGNTTEQAELLDSAMKEAAANSTFGMTDAAEATLNFARAGLSAEEAAAALAPAMNLAAGEGGTLDVVSAGLVATINGFHGSFSDASHYADVFAAACNNSALDVNSLSDAFSVAAPVFSSAGYAVEDAALYMGVMANNGIEAKVAANSLKSGISALVAPAKSGADMMDQLGISVTNADGTMKSSVQIQSELHDAFSQLSESEQLAAASAIFGKEQMAPWLALINTAPEEVQALDDSLRNCAGTTDEMAAAMMAGFGGAMEQLKSSIDVLITTVGGALAPTIQKVTDVIQGLVDKFLALEPSQQAAIAKFGLLAAAAGPAFLVIGNGIKLVGSAMQEFSALAEKVALLGLRLAGGTGAVGSFGEAIRVVGTKFGPVIAVVGLLVSAIVTLWTTNEEFRNKITEIWEKIKSVFETFAGGIVLRLNNLGFNFQSFSEVVGAIWQGFCDLLAPAFEGALSTLAVILQTVLDVLTGIFDIFSGIFTGNWDLVWTGIKEVFGGVWDGIKGIFQTAIDFIHGIADAILGWFGTSWNEVWTGIKDFFGDIWDGIVEHVSTAWETIKNAVNMGLQFIAELISTAFELITLPFRMIWENCKDVVIQAWENIKTAISTALEFVKNIIMTGFGAVRDALTTIWNGIKDFLTQAWENIKEVVQRGIDFVGNVIQTGFGAVRDAISTIWNGIKDTISRIWENIKTAVQGAVDSVRSKVETAFHSVKDTATRVWNSIKDAITGPIEKARDIVGRAVDAIKDKFNNMKLKFPDIKLPHFSVTGKFSIDPPSVPHFSIKWYKEGGILTKPMIFGMNGLNLMAGGEAGPEAILPLDNLYRELDRMLSEHDNNRVMERYLAIIAQNSSKGIYLEDGTLVGHLVPAIDNGLGRMQRLKQRGI